MCAKAGSSRGRLRCEALLFGMARRARAIMRSFQGSTGRILLDPSRFRSADIGPISSGRERHIGTKGLKVKLFSAPSFRYVRELTSMAGLQTLRHRRFRTPRDRKPQLVEDVSKDAEAA